MTATQEPLLNPECRQGKHANCDGWTMDTDDELVPCECTCHAEADR